MTKTLEERRKINDEINTILAHLLSQVDGVVGLDEYITLVGMRDRFADAIEEVLCPEDFDPELLRILEQLRSHLAIG